MIGLVVNWVGMLAAMVALLWALLLVLFEQARLVLVSLLSLVLESELVLVSTIVFSSRVSLSAQSVVVMMIYRVYLEVLLFHSAENLYKL